MALKNKKKILVIGERFYPEEFLINDVVKHWEQLGYDIRVLTQFPTYPEGKIYKGYKNKLFKKDYYNSVVIHRFLSITGYKEKKYLKYLNYLTFVFIGSLRVLFLAPKIDIILIYQTGPLTQAIPALLLKKIFHKKIIIWTWDLWPEAVYSYGFKRNKLNSYLLAHFVRCIYSSCDRILISSPGFEKSLKKYCHGKQLEVVTNWIKPHDKPSSSLEIIFEPDKTHFIFAGNIGTAQNIDSLLRGYAKAKKSNSNICFHIVGDGSALESLKVLVKNNSIEDVFFWGRVSESDVYKFYDLADFLVISLNPDDAYDKYVPSKFQTYLDVGKPILCAMNGEVADLVIKYELGKVAHPDNLEEISSAFIELINTSANEKKHILVTSKEVISTLFNRDINLNYLHKVICDLS